MTAQFKNVRIGSSGKFIVCERIVQNWQKSGFPLAELVDGEWVAIHVPDDAKKAKEHLGALDQFLNSGDFKLVS